MSLGWCIALIIFSHMVGFIQGHFFSNEELKDRVDHQQYFLGMAIEEFDDRLNKLEEKK